MKKTTYSEQEKLKAITLIASGIPISEISKQLGIPNKTLYAWKSNAENTELYRAIEKEKKEEHLKEAKDFANTLKTDFEEILKLSTSCLKNQLKEATEGKDKVEAARLSTIIGTIYDKHALISGNATQNISVSFEDMPE